MRPLFGMGLVVVIAYFVQEHLPNFSNREDFAGRALVLDGDTLELQGERIRIWGIDAPEGRQTCMKGGKQWPAGKVSASTLRRFLVGRAVTCEQRAIDRYGRSLASCDVEGDDIGAWLVREGWAWDSDHNMLGHYASEQHQAMQAKRGIWQADCEPPWEWRQRMDAEPSH